MAELRLPAESGGGSGENLVEEMTSGTVLNLQDPGVGIEAQFSCEAFLDLSLGSWFFAEAAGEQPIRWTRIVEHTLGRGAEQFRRAVKSIELDENGPRLLRSAPPNGSERAFDVAAADVGCDPDRRFQAHSRSRSSPPRGKYSRPAPARREPDGIFSSINQRGLRQRGSLFQRSAGHRRQLAHEPVGGLTRDRQPALALELLDRGLGLGIDDAAWLDLTVTVFGKCPL